MKKKMFRNGLVIGIIILFVMMSVIPSNAHVVKNSSSSTVGQVNSDDYTNYLGTIYFNFSRFSVEVGFTVPEDRNYTFPVIDGKYTLNFTVEFMSKSNQILFFPRIAFSYAKICADDTPVWVAYGFNIVRGEVVGPWEIKDIERNYNDPPINGRENVTLSIYLQGRGFPFGFLRPKGISFTITAYFAEGQ